MLRSFARFDIVQEREEFFGFKRSFASGETRRAENVVISLRVLPLRRVCVGAISRGGRRGMGGDRHGWSGCGRIGIEGLGDRGRGDLHWGAYLSCNFTSGRGGFERDETGSVIDRFGGRRFLSLCYFREETGRGWWCSPDIDGIPP